MANRGRLRWFVHFLLRSLTQRIGRVLVGASAVMIAVGIMVGALGLSLGIRGKLGSELKAYGANVILTPREGYLADDDALRSTLAGYEYTAQIYRSVTLEELEDVEMIGLDFTATAGWRVTGALPSDGQALIGTDLARLLGINAGDTITVRIDGREFKLTASGMLELGGPEDSAMLVPLDDARRIAGLEDKLSAVLLRVPSERVAESVSALSRALPRAQLRTVKQVAGAEEAFLGKIELLMALVTAVVLAASVISMSSTMSATVLERLKEIGLMKAIGGTRAEIGAFFMAEGAIIGLMGGLLGYALGWAAAQAVSRGAFDSYVDVPAVLFLFSLAAGSAISVLSSLVPLGGALRYKPSVILRGE